MTRYLFAAVLGLALLLSVQSWRLDRLKGELSEAKVALAEWNGYETRAGLAADEASEACSARVAEARRSTQRIETIIEKPYAVDSSGCPIRSLILAPELREALQPSATPDP